MTSGEYIGRASARTSKSSVVGRYCPFGDIIYSSLSVLELLRDTYHWDFVSEGRNHTPMGSLTDAQAQADICGSLRVLEQHGFRRAWGLFAYPGQRDVTTHIKVCVVPEGELEKAAAPKTENSRLKS